MATETGTIDLKAQVAAAKTASNYMAADSTGVKIANANPSTATTYQHQTSTNTEFIVDNLSVAEFGADGARVGQNSGSHLALDEHGLRYFGESGEKRLEVGDVQLMNKRVNDKTDLVPTVGSDGSKTFTLSLPQIRDDGYIAVKFTLARG